MGGVFGEKLVAPALIRELCSVVRQAVSLNWMVIARYPPCGDAVGGQVYSWQTWIVASNDILTSSTGTALAISSVKVMLCNVSMLQRQCPFRIENTFGHFLSVLSGREKVLEDQCGRTNKPPPFFFNKWDYDILKKTAWLQCRKIIQKILRL